MTDRGAEAQEPDAQGPAGRGPGGQPSDERGPQHVNRSALSGPADLVQARDVYGGVHFHSGDSSPTHPPPRQLPGDVRGFVNRVNELDSLDRLLADESVRATLVVICGTAGVGKPEPGN